MFRGCENIFITMPDFGFVLSNIPQKRHVSMKQCLAFLWTQSIKESHRMLKYFAS